MSGQSTAALESRFLTANGQMDTLTPSAQEKRFSPGEVMRSPPRPAANPTVGTIDQQVVTRIDSGDDSDGTQTARIIRPVVFKALPTRSRLGHFIALQRWEGVVLEVARDTFTARLVDRTTPNADEEAEFPLEEVSPADLQMVTPGAVFYWAIGYLDRPSGQRLRQSLITFRRLPAWSEAELEHAKRRADQLLDKFAQSE